MLQIPKIEFQPYKELIWRRKWWIAVPLALSLVSGAVYVSLSPKLYKASTLILVESQRVPDAYVQQTVTESLQNRLRTISQQVNSRTNLEGVIEQFGLDASQPQQKNKLQEVFEKAKAKLFALIGSSNSAASKEENGQEDRSRVSQVGNVRSKIDISLKSGNRAFEISFAWKDPQVAAQVANALASQFIEQNLKVREEMAMGTTRFLDYEVDRIREDLIEKENALEAFKRKHMGMLPSQLGSNLDILNQKRQELDNLEKRVDMDKQQAMMLEEQGGDQPVGIAQLEQQLEILKTRYTDKHPDCRALRRRIENLKQHKAMNATDASIQGGTAVSGFSQQDTSNPQLEKIRARISRYEKEIEQVKAEIARYQERIEKTSEVELQLKNLQRDYETVNKRYQSLLSKKLNSQMAEELEKRQKGEQFRVIDSAIAPKKPYSPDVNKIMIMALVLGAGIGGGLAYARESMDPAFYNHEEVEEYLGTKVLVSLPFAEKNVTDQGLS